MTKFHGDRAKIVDFLLIVNFWSSPIFFDSYFIHDSMVFEMYFTKKVDKAELFSFESL